ncbi:MAG: insulinase family protein, partial [Flavobacteriaceae bacterium]|nr:insulinase family protein [Flavobacteriaceae bacterium]
VEAMTLEEVNKAASKYLIPSNRTIGRFHPTKDPERVAIPHVANLDSLVSGYKGKESKGTGEAFDVAYDKIEERLQRGELDNGIKYGFIEKSNRGATVTFNFSIRNGDVKSLSNKGMIPSFTAAMLNKGTTNMTRQEIEDELSRLKSSVNLYARNGNTYASIESTEENLQEVVKLMIDMIKNPAFEPSELEKIKTERLANLENNKTEPQFLASQRLGEINNTFPKGHPNYTMTIEEQEAAIKAVTVEDIRKFHDEFYGLGKSILVSIGDQDVDQLKSMMQEAFTGFESDHPYSEIKNPFQANKPVHEDIQTPDKQNAMTLGGQSINISEYHEDYAALTIASTILGGGFLNSRIADRLRQKDGVSYGAGAGFQADSDKDDSNSRMFIYAIYAPANYDKVQLGFKEEIARFIADGITEEELKDAINGWVQGRTVSRAKDNELASLVNNNIYYDRDMEFHKSIEDKVTSLTVEEVNAAIKKYIKPFTEWTVVNAGDFKKEGTE